MTIDVKDGKVTVSNGCRVTNARGLRDGVTFTRLDEGLPLNRGILSASITAGCPCPIG